MNVNGIVLCEIKVLRVKSLIKDDFIQANLRISWESFTCMEIYNLLKKSGT